MRLATRRLHALDNVAPLTFPVCGVCDKAIMADPHEDGGKTYHQGGCLIELGRRVTEEIWQAREAKRIAAEEEQKRFGVTEWGVTGTNKYIPPVTYQPFTTVGGTSGPYLGNGLIMSGSNAIPASWSPESGAAMTIFLPANMLSTSGSMLVETTPMTVDQVSGTAATHMHGSTYTSSSWDTIALRDGDSIQFTASVSGL